MTKDPFYERFIFYLDQMGKESDRGSVIVSIAILDDVLCQLLKAKMLPSIEKNDELFDSAMAPYSSFSSRIDLAYRIGIIRANVRASMHQLRKIRNNFAHATEVNGFDSPSTQDRIRAIIEHYSDYVDAIISSIREKLENENIEVRKMPEMVGWRTTLEILFSSIAASLEIQISSVPKIEKLE